MKHIAILGAVVVILNLPSTILATHDQRGLYTELDRLFKPR